MPPRILLADDSPHAQRMGERILREEGFEVVTVTDGGTVLHRLNDVNPDVVLVDAFLTDLSGYEICKLIKADPKHGRAGVILVAGLLEPVSEDEAKAAGADAVLKKPFEASAVIDAVRPLIEKARRAPLDGAVADESKTNDEAAAETVEVGETAPESAAASPDAAFTKPVSAAPQPVETAPEPEAPLAVAEAAPVQIDKEIVRAAVTVALDRAFPSLVDEITRRVLESLPSPDDPGASNKV